MPSLSFVTLDVFTTERLKGNPLGLVRVPKGHDISSEQMQTIAKEFNLSETVFLHDDGVTSDDGVIEWRFRIFLTNAEVPFAGHPTIGAACYALGTLANNASRGRLLCNAGPIEIDYNDGCAKASIPHNIHIHERTKFTAEQVYELQPRLKGWSMNIDVVSPVKGLNFICVDLPRLEALENVQLSRKPAAELDEGWDAIFVGSYFYVVTRDTSEKLEIQARMIEGSFEDPATGSAASALAALLALKWKRRNAGFEITQGVEMGRQSNITVDVTLNEAATAVEKIVLGGSAVMVMEGTIHY